MASLAPTVSERELRLRQRIDVLTDERDAALAELTSIRNDIRKARTATARQPDDPAHAWLAEYDRRRAARKARRRERAA